MPRGPREDETISMLNVPIIQKIVDIMLTAFPLGSKESSEILGSYLDDGDISNMGIDYILLAIEEDRELSRITFNEIADNEAGIIPYYIKKLGHTVESIRQKIRVAGTGRQEQ